MRIEPPQNIKGELKNSSDGTDFFAVVEFTIDNTFGSRLFYPTEAEAWADEMNHVGMAEKHIHVYRISSDGAVLQVRTLQKRFPNVGKGYFGKTEPDTGARCWEQLSLDTGISANESAHH
jgi:hypothetical protein